MMLDSLFSAVIDFLLHVLCYRIGEIVLRVFSLGHLSKRFFDKYTYFTILVGALSIVILGYVIWLLIH